MLPPYVSSFGPTIIDHDHLLSEPDTWMDALQHLATNPHSNFFDMEGDYTHEAAPWCINTSVPTCTTIDCCIEFFRNITKIMVVDEEVTW